MKRFCPFLLILFVFCGHAQQIPFKLLKSELFTDEFSGGSQIKLAEDDGQGGLLVVRSFFGGNFSFARGYYFEKYDAQLKLLKAQAYDMEYRTSQDYSKVFGIFNDGAAVHLVEICYDKKLQACVCTAHNISTEDFKGERKELFRLTNAEMEQYGFVNLRDFVGISFAVNRDKSAFAISLELASRKSGKIKTFIFDKELNKITEQYFDTGLKENDFILQSLDLSADGKTAYLLGKAYTKALKKKEDGGRYEFQLIAIDALGQKTQAYETGEHFVESLKVVAIEDKLACLGFYSDKKDNRYKGICYLAIDPASLQLTKTVYNPFTAQFFADKYGDEKQKDLKNLKFRSLLLAKNKDLIFNAEEYFESGGSAPGHANTTAYHYDDIVCARLNPDGELVWARNINKRQTADSDVHVSYSSMVKDDDTYFFINAAEKIKKISNDRIEFKGASKNRSDLNAIRISKDGLLDYQELLDNEMSAVSFMVSSGANSGNSQYFIGWKGKNKQLLKITF